MLSALGGGLVESVLLAAGQVGMGSGEEFKRAQGDYEKAIIDGVRGLCPAAEVVWSKPKDDVWSACYYLPLAEEAALFKDGAGTFHGLGHDEAAKEHGMAEYNYPSVEV